MREFAAFLRCRRFWPSLFRRFGFRAISRPAGRFGHRFREFVASCRAAGFPRRTREFAAFLPRGRFWPSLFRRFGFRAISRPAGRFGHRFFGVSAFGRCAGGAGRTVAGGGLRGIGPFSARRERRTIGQSSGSSLSDARRRSDRAQARPVARHGPCYRPGHGSGRPVLPAAQGRPAPCALYREVPVLVRNCATRRFARRYDGRFVDGPAGVYMPKGALENGPAAWGVRHRNA
jgi:hypothetical protein